MVKTCPLPIYLPLGPITATVQLAEWASSPIYLSMGVLLCVGDVAVW